jgi:hypothetical protein
MLIQATIEAAGPGGQAYVFVSAVDPDGVKNILTADQKLPLLKHMFPSGVTFIHTKKDCLPTYKNCGGPYVSFKWLTDKDNGPGFDPKDITLVIGKERLTFNKEKPNEYFGPENDAWGGVKPANFISVGESAERDPNPGDLSEKNMSGTKARGYAKAGNKQSFYIALGYDPNTPDSNVDAVYETIQHGKKGGSRESSEEDEGGITTEGPDGEPKGGRRKTRRSRNMKSKRIRRTNRRRSERK